MSSSDIVWNCFVISFLPISGVHLWKYKKGEFLMLRHINLVNFFNAVTISMVAVCMMGISTVTLADNLVDMIRALNDDYSVDESTPLQSSPEGDVSGVDDLETQQSHQPKTDGGVSDDTLNRDIAADVMIPEKDVVSLINNEEVSPVTHTNADGIFDWLLWLIGGIAFIILIFLFCRKIWKSRQEREYNQLGKSPLPAPEDPSVAENVIEPDTHPSSKQDASVADTDTEESDQKKDEPVSEAVAENVIEPDTHPSSKQDASVADTDTEESDQKKDEPVSEAVAENVIEPDTHPSSKQDASVADTDTEESDQKKDEPVSEAVAENVIEPDTHPSSKQDASVADTDTEESDQKKDEPVVTVNK